MLRVGEMVKKVTALKARKNLGELLEEVYYRGDQYVIERAGKPMAAIVPLWQLEAWLQRREEFFDMVDEVHRRPQDVTLEVIEQDLQEAIRAVRAGDRRPT